MFGQHHSPRPAITKVYITVAHSDRHNTTPRSDEEIYSTKIEYSFCALRQMQSNGAEDEKITEELRSKVIPAYTIRQTASAEHWRQFQEMVEDEGWDSDDHTVLTFLPHLQSTRLEIAVDEDDKLIGALVWNAYDGIAFVGFYVVHQDLRGLGIGSRLWENGMHRIGNTPAALRAGEVVENYY
ncbi:hypothetical protein AB6A40_009690 [Gnathostoma spinigerum]|uniref:N-acetyltransferase domain-containing protein n=1 Tax=Gnathostoma spinigerum TaxID=75299 RepID=A0ABD6EUH4_9BILA